MAHDYDWLVVGSGFGGSVAALRLTEKGYRVGVLECGRRFADDEFPRSTWDVRRYFFAPRLGPARASSGCRSSRTSSIVSGAGVGGGSLGYANTLYRARPRFYEDPQWAGLDDWEAALAPHYDEAERMLGVADRRRRRPGRRPAARVRRARSASSDTYAKTRVGVLLRRAGRDGRRPVLRRRGPRPHRLHRAAGAAWSAARTAPRTRSSRTTCGSPSARRARSCPSARSSTSARSARGDGSDGYEVTTERTGAWLRKDRQTLHRRAAWSSPPARSAPTSCCSAASSHGSLPRVSDRLGELVRTNSEAILAVTAAATTRATSPSASRSPARSTPTRTRTSRPSPTATPATR